MWPTIIIASIIAILVVSILINEIIKKKKGKNSCSCGCDGCSMKNDCHKK